MAVAMVPELCQSALTSFWVLHSNDQMNNTEGKTTSTDRIHSATASVLVYWIGYVVITALVGFLTSQLISSEVWQLIAWGLISSVGLLMLSHFMHARTASTVRLVPHRLNARGLKLFAWGLFLGVVSFAVHVLIITRLTGPIAFELNPAVGVFTVLIFFLRFVATSWMEELGFRGYALQRLIPAFGVWFAVILSAVVFGLSHLLYGWDFQTILLGVIPPGMLWGMSAVVTRGIAMPIGLHAAWNFSAWTSGTRKETGLLQMVVDENNINTTVTTSSYLLIFGLMTLGFWWYGQKRQSNRGASV